ncbi:hypothetical protein F4604DRAFT_1676376 [Suillus subluteus]|nr:hypothetical protein F4604DRAFT_1676376 [Suillus subluteus]
MMIVTEIKVFMKKQIVEKTAIGNYSAGRPAAASFTFTGVIPDKDSLVGDKIQPTAFGGLLAELSDIPVVDTEARENSMIKASHPHLQASIFSEVSQALPHPTSQSTLPRSSPILKPFNSYYIAASPDLQATMAFTNTTSYHGFNGFEAGFQPTANTTSFDAVGTQSAQPVIHPLYASMSRAQQQSDQRALLQNAVSHAPKCAKTGSDYSSTSRGSEEGSNYAPQVFGGSQIAAMTPELNDGAYSPTGSSSSLHARADGVWSPIAAEPATHGLPELSPEVGYHDSPHGRHSPSDAYSSSQGNKRRYSEVQDAPDEEGVPWTVHNDCIQSVQFGPEGSIDVVISWPLAHMPIQHLNAPTALATFELQLQDNTNKVTAMRREAQDEEREAEELRAMVVKKLTKARELKRKAEEMELEALTNRAALDEYYRKVHAGQLQEMRSEGDADFEDDGEEYGVYEDDEFDEVYVKEEL